MRLIKQEDVTLLFCMIWGFVFVLCGSDNAPEQSQQSNNAIPSAPDSNNLSPETMYQRLFRHKRASHMEAVKAVVDLEKYEKQYRMVSLLTDKIIKVLGDSKLFLMESGFTPGDPFPTDEKIRDAYSQVAENLAFFGDLLLRLPDITHDILKRKKENTMIINWAFGFCNETKTYQGNDAKMLHLVAQELGIIEKDPDYVNPYKEETLMNQMAEEIADEVVSEALKKAQKKLKRKEKRKGPRLTGEL